MLELISNCLLYANSSDGSDETPQNAHVEEFIDGIKCYGLVATASIPTSETIFDEVAMPAVLRDAFESWSEYDLAIGHDVQRMSPEWQEEFSKLPTNGNDVKGGYASRFDEACIPINWSGERINILGITARSLNHGCLPNAQITFFQDREGENGEISNRIVCRSCKEIRRGEEITVAYSNFTGDVAVRQRDIFRVLGFQCTCSDCVRQRYHVEKNLATIHTYYGLVKDEEMVQSTPTKAFKIYHILVKAHARAGLFDLRLGELFEQCAYICARHSDSGRADFFLKIAHAIYRLVQGGYGMDTGRAAYFLRGIDRIPKSFTSNRGRSKQADAVIFDPLGEGALRLAFMLDAHDDEYITLAKQAEIDLENKAREERLERERNFENIHKLIEDIQLEKDKEDQTKRCQQGIGPGKTKKKKGRRSKAKTSKANGQPPESIQIAVEKDGKENKGDKAK